MSSTDGLAAVTSTDDVDAPRRLAPHARAARAATGPHPGTGPHSSAGSHSLAGPSGHLTDIRARRKELQQHLRTSRAVHRLVRAHFDVAARDMLLPRAAALAALPTSRDGQSPPAGDLLRAFGGATAPAGLHTLSRLLQHLERYESNLSEEMDELTESLVHLLQGDPRSCLPKPRSTD